ncbi:cobalamin biosynthesis protein, partial [Streptomyces tendae]
PVLNGAAGRAVRAGSDDIDRAVRLSRRVGWLALGVCAGARLLARGARASIRQRGVTKGRTS